MGGVVPKGENNDELIDNLVEAGYIEKPDVEKVFRAVDRIFFYPGEYEDDVYKDLAMKEGNIHISAPCIYSSVMDNMEFKEGVSFLNIGSGTGYLSTLAGLMIGFHSINHGIDIYQDVLECAMKNVCCYIQHDSGFNHQTFCKPEFFLSNITNLDTDIKYDRVYCGARVPDEGFLSCIKGFVKEGGIIIYPYGESLIKTKCLTNGEWEVEHLSHVQFSDLQLNVIPQSPTIYVQPHSLKELCRFEIVRHIPKDQLNDATSDLSLPSKLIRYLQFYRDGKPSPPMKLKRRNSEMELTL